MWVLKEKGQSWDALYFRNIILINHVLPFLKNPNNVIDVKQTTFLHDRSPCMKALETQKWFKDNELDFFGNSEWPGSSPDLNVTENLGAILKTRVDEVLISLPEDERSRGVTVNRVLEAELSKMENDTELFYSLLSSYPDRMAAVKDANGWHTNY